MAFVKDLNVAAVVYQAVNLLNGKKYIGITKKSVSQRQYQHSWFAKKGIKTTFGRAIRKYGIDNFQFSILHRTSTYQEALELEKQLISELKPEYNMSKGGVAPTGVTWSEERRAKTLPSLRASWTEERKKKHSVSSRKAITPERIANLLKIRPDGFKTITCLNDGKIFKSVDLAKEFYGISNISSVLVGRQLTCGDGLAFVELKDGVPLDETERLKRLADIAEKKAAFAKKLSAGFNNRSVICITTNERFSSAVAAAKAFGVSNNRVAQICNGLGKLRTGHTFMWADTEFPPEIKTASPEQLAKAKADILAALSRGVEKNKKKVICLDSGKIYGSISDAARAHDVHVSALSAGIYRNGRTAGLRFQFMEAA